MSKFCFTPYKSLDISDIIFDLGGVVLDIDYRLTLRAFTQLGAKNLEEIYTLTAQREVVSQFERGQIDAHTFMAELRSLLGIDLAYDDAVKAWNAMVLQWNPQRMRLLERLADQFGLHLLSNTNTLHRDLFEPELVKATGHGIDCYFKNVFYSFEMGMRKPEPEIFAEVLRRAQLNPARTLFIDDNASNVEAARAQGIAAYRIDPATECIDDLFVSVD